jgi:hypothetical protein
MYGAKSNNNHVGHSGFGFVDKMETVGARVLFAVEPETAGSYTLNIRYANSMGNTRTASLYVNDVKQGQLNLPNLPNWDSWGIVQETVVLESGVNYISIQYDETDTGYFNLDNIYLSTGSGTVEVTNPGFETGNISGWSEWHPYNQPTAYGVDSYDVHSGSYKCYFWSDNSYKQSIHQIINGLDSGSYTLRAWVKLSVYGGTPYTARMEAIGIGGADQYYSITPDGIWKPIELTMNITSGQIDIGFYVHSPGRTSLQIDDVEIIKN